MIRRGLGKGLGALIPTREEPVEITQNSPDIDIQLIDPNPYQPRHLIRDEELQELTTSITLHGLLQPLVVHKDGDRYQLIAGERRLRASKRAGLTSVPVVVRDCTPREMLEIALVENLQREDINALESAQAYQQLATEFGLTQEEIATRVGKSRPSIANTMRLLQLPDPLKESLLEGTITEGHARALLSLESKEAMIQLWKRVVKKALSVRQTERLAQRITKGKNRQESSILTSDDPNITDVVHQLETKYGTKVQIQARKKGGTLTLRYYSEEDLIRLVDQLLGEITDNG